MAIIFGVIMKTKEDIIEDCATQVTLLVWHPEHINGKALGRKIADALNSDPDFTTGHILEDDNKYIYDFVYHEKWTYPEE